MRKRRVLVLIIVLVLVVGVLAWWFLGRGPKPGQVKDEAMLAGVKPENMPSADEDFFAEMDYGVSKDPEKLRQLLDPFMPGITAQEAKLRFVRGRNNWNVWSGGNDRQWDLLNPTSFGTLDLLRILSSHPKMKHGRHDRWQYYGLVNEPCFQKAKAPRTDRFGLWLDERKPGCQPDPYENEQKYPGVKIGARGTTVPVGSYYGYSTGVLGMRLFPNPAFDEEAKKRWDPERYITDPEYYNDKSLVKPYRVGMSCGLCHIGPNPSNPPVNPEEPEWANLNSNPGAQYFWVDRIFVANPDPQNFAYQLFHTSRPGALDTSFVSSDQINNPRTMNAIYNFPGRMEVARKWHHETLKGPELHNKQFNDFAYVKENSALRAFYDPNSKTVRTPLVLKDGSDSVGALGALNRVYVNIGLFSEEWFLHFMPLIGGPKITPFPIEHAEKNSTYWKATEMQTVDVALFFLASAPPDKLAVAPGAGKHLADAGEIPRGQQVFADRCARCHSSKLPPKAFNEFFKPGCVGPNYMQCFDAYWKWTKTPEFKQAMLAEVMKPDFLDGNALTNDIRVPSTLLETQACSPLATNALGGDIWDNFSSSSYKSLPSVGEVIVQDPYTGKVSKTKLPGDGRGFTRPPSLVSLWSTAPFLVNNSLGRFDWVGSVDGRMLSFNDSIQKLLWPERREGPEVVVTKSGLQHPGHIDRLPEKAYLKAYPKYLPGPLQGLPNVLGKAMPNVFHEGKIRVGPFPKGTPINLVSNVDLSKKLGVAGFGISFLRYLESVDPNDSDEVTAKKFEPLIPKLMALSKCNDFIVNKGHYFGTDYLPASEGEPGLSDADKRALIAYLKTF
jgi:hypothetical protein